MSVLPLRTHVADGVINSTAGERNDRGVFDGEVNHLQQFLSDPFLRQFVIRKSPQDVQNAQTVGSISREVSQRL